METQQNLLFDIVDFVNHRGANLLILSTPIVDDVQDDKCSKWSLCFRKLRLSFMHDAKDEGMVIVNGLGLNDVYKIAKKYPAAVHTLELDLQYLVEENEPEIVFDNDLPMYTDMYGYGVTIKNNYRITSVAQHSGQRVLCFGNSVMYGYMVPDSKTLPWCLQTLLPDKNVLNYAVLSDKLSDIVKRIATTPLREGDFVVIQQTASVLKAMQNTWPLPIVNADIDVAEPFVDGFHLTYAAHQRIATQLAALINSKQRVQSFSKDEKNKIDQLIVRCNAVNMHGKSVGATVMSCNPFTRGHEWLCENGARLFDDFFVFVMQDDLDCVFSQNDMVQLVNVALSKFDNVHVVWMDNLFGYSEFWPEYITKTMMRQFGIDTRRLLRCVAEVFNAINVQWFVCGDESNDVITAQHVDSAQCVFAAHGVRTIVLPRKQLNGVKCATSIRDSVLAGDYSMLPASCVDWIKAHNIKPLHATRRMLMQRVNLHEKEKKVVAGFSDVVDVVTDRLDKSVQSGDKHGVWWISGK